MRRVRDQNAQAGTHPRLTPLLSVKNAWRIVTGSLRPRMEWFRSPECKSYIQTRINPGHALAATKVLGVRMESKRSSPSFLGARNDKLRKLRLTYLETVEITAGRVVVDVAVTEAVVVETEVEVEVRLIVSVEETVWVTAGCVVVEVEVRVTRRVVNQCMIFPIQQKFVGISSREYALNAYRFMGHSLVC